jgi:Fe-S cluster assembly iron-binding protein IscA
MRHAVVLTLFLCCSACGTNPAPVAEPETPDLSTEPTTVQEDSVSLRAHGTAGAMAPTVQLTPRAAERVRALVAESPERDKLRVNLVERFGGDRHWQITMVQAVDPFDDEVVTVEGLALVVNRGTRPYLTGITIDFAEVDGKAIFLIGSQHSPQSR